MQLFPEANLECPHRGEGYTHSGFMSWDYEMRRYKCQQCGYRDESGVILAFMEKKYPDFFTALRR